MLVSSSQILICMLYFVTELYAGLKHFQGRQAPVLLAFLIIFGSVAYLLIPGWILYKELSVSTNDTSTSDSHELLIEANNDSKPFLDKYNFENLEDGTMYNATDGRPPTGKKARTSESSLEQMLGIGTRAHKGAVSPEPVADDESTASTRSFIRGLGSGSVDSNTELELYRARAASAFTNDSGSRSTTKALYADKPAVRRMTVAQLELAAEEGDTSDAAAEKKDDEEEKDSATPLNAPTRYPQPLSPIRGISSPTRIRGLHDNFGIPSIPEESRVSLYSPSGPVPTNMPPLPPQQLNAQDRLGSFLRQRSVAPLRPRVSQDGQTTTRTSLAGGITQVAAATAALDPNKILPMLMKLGVSSVEAAGMMTYLMRMKELGDGKKKKNSLAMVV